MATVQQYNEVNHSMNYSDDINSLDPMFRFNAHFPSKLARLQIMDDHSFLSIPSKTRRNRNNARFKTQPVTFDEIQEVDEDDETSKMKNNFQVSLNEHSHSVDNLLIVPVIACAEWIEGENCESFQVDMKKNSESSCDGSQEGVNFPMHLTHGQSRARRSQRKARKKGIQNIPETEHEMND